MHRTAHLTDMPPRCRQSRAAPVALGCAFALLLAVEPLAARAAEPWLFVNDVHLNPSSTERDPVGFGEDTNPALLASALAEMRRVAPNPPVIVIAGDFLGHHFKSADAIPTMIALAHRFDGVFPHAQFIIALGNEDADCGDYAVAPNSAFLRAVAQAWAPLVDRGGAAPDFVRSFSRDGFYTARLPIRGVRAVIVNDTFWSPFYHNGCSHGDPTPASFSELSRALAPSRTERRWVIMHIPPGIDASSTVHLTRRLAIVPFLRPLPRARAVALLSDPARHVELVVTGHIHRFAYRILGARTGNPVPLLVSPAISPLFSNAPSFLTAEVAADGRILNLEEHARTDGEWHDVGGLGTLELSEFTGPALLDLQRRLSRDAGLREKFSRLYLGGTRWREIDEGNWRSYWCVATEFDANGFRRCLDERGFSYLTGRGVAVVGVAAAAALAALATLVAVIVRRRRRRRSV